ncbi:MAG: diguanylate cyclase [Coriobacteriia bacterium]|nr:diguanylate cyclase [Coriobacteriia bacterium]
MHEPNPPLHHTTSGAVWGEHETAAFDRAVITHSQNAVVACDENGDLVVFNPAARTWHGMDARALPPEQWSSYYGLYESDGVTPYPTDQLPLTRTFRGETIRDVPLVIKAEGQEPRHVACGGGPFYDDSGKKLGAFVVMVDTTAMHHLTRELEHLASHDVLTGLANRRTFESEVERATRFAARGVISTVLFADVDRFKTCNDLYGHEFGDKVLSDIAQRMRSVVRAVDTVARIGGDEFGVVLWGKSGEAVDLVAVRLSETVAAAGRVYDLDIGLSIGSAVVAADSDASRVLAEADSQMYGMKATGGHGGAGDVGDVGDNL